MRRVLFIILAGCMGAVLITAIVASRQVYYEELLETTLSAISEKHASQTSQMIQEAVVRPLALYSVGEPIVVPTTSMQVWLETYYRPFTGRQEVRLNSDAVASYLTELAPHLNTEPKNAQFSAENGVLIESVPAQNGQTLDIPASTHEILRALVHDQSTAPLVFSQREAEYSLGHLSSLGINALLARGTSNFTGSPASRKHNIRVGSAKFNNILVQPGEEFSFVDHLGTVDETTGYLPELVIKGDKVIPEYGGGLCQVSTTTFRAAILSGLPITERRPHSFPVQYYNPQGFDSTIYPGVVDLKFVNDTPGPILIQTSIEGNKLNFDFFGASDGRTTAIKGPVILEAPGDGSLKTNLVRTITYASGETKKDSFYSAYKSPSLFETIRNPLE